MTAESAEAANDRRVRLFMTVAIGAIAVFCLAYMLVYLQDDARDGYLLGVKFSDFLVFYSSGPALKAGGVELLFDVDRFTRFQQELLQPWISTPLQFRPWLYPPPMLLFTAPLAIMPFMVSALALQALGAAALFYALERRVLPFLALIASPAFALNFVSGQNSALWAACLVGGLRMAEARPVHAGMVLGLLVLKPQLALLVPFALLALGARRALLSMMLTGAALVIASLLFPGWEAWRAFLNAATGPNVVLQEVALQRVGAMMGSVQASFRLAGGGSSPAAIAQVTVTVGAVIGVFAAFRLIPDRSLAVLLTAPLVLLASPYWMSYDLIIVGAALAWYVARQQTIRPLAGEEVVWYCVWILPFVVFALNRQGLPVASPMLILAAFMTVLRARRETDRATLP
jgi:alpha-1,2-mannosyltransferase